MIREGLLTGIDHKTACKNFVKAASKGVIKVMSKMGISAIQSYRGAQVFEALGLRQDVIDHYFTWTASRVGGIGLDVIAQEVLMRHRAAYPDRQVNGHVLPVGGLYQWRAEGEAHLFTPGVDPPPAEGRARTGQLRRRSRTTRSSSTSRARTSARCAACSISSPPPRSRSRRSSRSKAIVKRFKTGAMSYGSISARRRTRRSPSR